MHYFAAAAALAVQVSGAAVVTPKVMAPALVPSDQAIKRAIVETLAESRAAEPARRHEADTLRANRYQTFAAAFAEAKVPDCLHADGLKRQSTNIGPIKIVGTYALVFVALAKVRGKCNQARQDGGTKKSEPKLAFSIQQDQLTCARRSA